MDIRTLPDIHDKAILPKCRSSCPEVFCKKGVLRNFGKFTGKHQCQSLFFNKVAGLRPATLLEKRPWHRCFRVNIVKFLRTSFLTEHLWWLLLTLCNRRLMFLLNTTNHNLMTFDLLKDTHKSNRTTLI